jgi:hypothetical protein
MNRLSNLYICGDLSDAFRYRVSEILISIQEDNRCFDCSPETCTPENPIFHLKLIRRGPRETVISYPVILFSLRSDCTTYSTSLFIPVKSCSICPLLGPAVQDETSEKERRTADFCFELNLNTYVSFC